MKYENKQEETRILAVERRQALLATLARDGKLIAADCAVALGVSEDTIRRDLRDLAAEGKLQRVHGGALPRSPATRSYTARAHTKTAAHQAIARSAAALVRDGMVILIGGGTTNVQLAQLLPLDLQATVITHNPPVAVALAAHEHVEVVLVGGRLFKHAMVTVGAGTLEAIQRVRADICMLGVCSVHAEEGISIPDLEESYIQRAMIRASAEVVALAAREKLGSAAPYIVGSLRDLTYLVTDATADDATVAACLREHVSVRRVG